MHNEHTPCSVLSLKVSWYYGFLVHISVKCNFSEYFKTFIKSMFNAFGLMRVTRSKTSKFEKIVYCSVLIIIVYLCLLQNSLFLVQNEASLHKQQEKYPCAPEGCRKVKGYDPWSFLVLPEWVKFVSSLVHLSLWLALYKLLHSLTHFSVCSSLSDRINLFDIFNFIPFLYIISVCVCQTETVIAVAVGVFPFFFIAFVTLFVQ